METLTNRFSSLKLRNGKVLKNRVVVPPMASETASHEGFVTDKTLLHYQNLGRAQAGLVLVEYTFVHSSGRSEEFQLGISSDAHIAGVSKLADLIHASGALAGIQLNHGGGKSDRELTGGSLMSPSGISVPVKGQEMEVPDSMSIEDIDLWKNSFVVAAGRAVEAGFDLIELHSAHGYGLNQWLSPITNQREDHYGRNLQGRMRLLLEIVQSIRMNHPQILISVRMPGQDFLEEGLSNMDAITVAKALEAVGVDIINVSSGIGGWRRPAVRIGEGYLVADAAQIQANVAVPVIGVGGIETGKFIDQAIRDSKFSLAAVGRAILKNPIQWGRDNLCQAMS